MPAWIALAAAAITAVGSIEAGQAQANAANYQGQVAKNNAIIANQNANYATEAGDVQAFNTALTNRGAAGRIKANQAANNIDVNSGSALKVQQSQREVGLQNVEQVKANAQLQAYGYRSQATGYTAQSGLYGQEAAQAPIGADIGAAGSLLKGASGLSFGSIFASGAGDGTGGSNPVNNFG